MDWRTLLLSPEGRINRQTFWFAFLLVMVSSFVLNVVPVIGQIIGLLLLWPQVCIHAKRLHDMGRTAWLMLIPAAVTLAATSLAMAFGGAAILGAGLMHYMGAHMAGQGALTAGLGAAAGFMSLAMLAGLAFLLWVGLTPSQAGDNRFGAAPAPGLPRQPPPADPAEDPPPPTTPLAR